MTPKATGVVRIDSGRTHGFQVRINKNKRRYTRLFSDSMCGGQKAAFKQAVAYREKLVAEVDDIPEKAPRHRLIRDNKSESPGVVGITRKYRRNSRGIRIDAYVVSWNPEPSRTRTKSFSFKKYGEDAAFKLACKLRFEKMKEIHGDRYDVVNYMELYRQRVEPVMKPAPLREDSHTPPKRRDLNTEGIFRADSGHTHGYHVRVMRRGKMYAKLFSDLKCGGMEAAFWQAVVYRKKLVAEVDAKPKNNPRRRRIRHDKNDSPGVAGISRMYKRNSRGIKYDVYCIRWSLEPGVQHGTTISIKRYGEDTAFKMACKLRFQKMKEIYGDQYEVASYMDLYRLRAETLTEPVGERVGLNTIKSRKKPRAKGVYRTDSDAIHGYQVKVYRHKKTYSKVFSDSKCGGKESAFKQAVAYRKKLVAEVDAMLESDPRRRRIRDDKDSSPGVVGISRMYRRNSRGIMDDVYSIRWSPEPGVGRGTTVSIKKYGEDTAFKRACELRFEKMKEIHGDRYEVANLHGALPAEGRRG